jgi:hypothetical protein
MAQCRMRESSFDGQFLETLQHARFHFLHSAADLSQTSVFEADMSMDQSLPAVTRSN